MPTSDLDQTLLPFQRQLAWAVIARGEDVAAMLQWLKDHPEPTLEAVPDETIQV